MLGSQAGHRVDGGDRGLAGLAVGAAALDLDGLAGAGEEQVVHGSDFDPADLGAAVAGAPGAALERDVLPRQGLQLLAQVLLVAFDDRDVVGPATEEVAGVFALGVQRVAGDDRPGEVGDGVQQRLEAGELFGFTEDPRARSPLTVPPGDELSLDPPINSRSSVDMKARMYSELRRCSRPEAAGVARCPKSAVMGGS